MNVGAGAGWRVATRQLASRIALRPARWRGGFPAAGLDGNSNRNGNGNGNGNSIGCAGFGRSRGSTGVCRIARFRVLLNARARHIHVPLAA
jgi:hypothetical protein